MQLVIAITALPVAVESVVMKFTSIVVAPRAKRHVTTRETACCSETDRVMTKGAKIGALDERKDAIKREQNQASMLCRAKAASNDVQPIFKLTLKNY